jgi:hypothetical protein
MYLLHHCRSQMMERMSCRMPKKEQDLTTFRAREIWPGTLRSEMCRSMKPRAEEEEIRTSPGRPCRQPSPGRPCRLHAGEISFSWDTGEIRREAESSGRGRRRGLREGWGGGRARGGGDLAGGVGGGGLVISSAGKTRKERGGGENEG